jgi:hypothetical protein
MQPAAKFSKRKKKTRKIVDFSDSESYSQQIIRIGEALGEGETIIRGRRNNGCKKEGESGEGKKEGSPET